MWLSGLGNCQLSIWFPVLLLLLLLSMLSYMSRAKLISSASWLRLHRLYVDGAGHHGSWSAGIDNVRDGLDIASTSVTVW